MVALGIVRWDEAKGGGAFTTMRTNGEMVPAFGEVKMVLGVRA